MQDRLFFFHLCLLWNLMPWSTKVKKQHSSLHLSWMNYSPKANKYPLVEKD